MSLHIKEGKRRMPIASHKAQGDTTSKVALLVAAKMQTSNKTQKEVARAIGYYNSNIITMLKQGLTKVPKLAKELDLDPEEFTRMCLEEYTPEILKTIEQWITPLSTVWERELLNRDSQSE